MSKEGIICGICGSAPCNPECENASTPESNDLLCVMPKELTAENGAKFLLSGEFYVTTTSLCPACKDSDDIVNCSCCEGVGEIEERACISWTTIKEIYAMAVKHLAEKTQNHKQISS